SMPARSSAACGAVVVPPWYQSGMENEGDNGFAIKVAVVDDAITVTMPGTRYSITYRMGFLSFDYWPSITRSKQWLLSLRGGISNEAFRGSARLGGHSMDTGHGV